jgi:PAS domain S-box-containing protein
VHGSEADKPSDTDLSKDALGAGLEAELLLGSEPFRLLVESVKDYGIFMLNPAGNVATWNEGARRIKGYAAEEILGRHFSTFYPPEDNARGKPAYELRVAAADGRFEDEGWRVRKDGSMFWANVVITALRNEDGGLLGFAKVTRDLTERRAAEERAIAQASALAAEEAARRVGSSQRTRITTRSTADAGNGAREPGRGSASRRRRAGADQ